MLPISSLNVDAISILNLKGRGGKEQLINSILNEDSGWKRDSHILYDYSNDLLGCLVECKKQQDLQWIDPSKYHDVTDEQKNILFLFLVIDKNGIVDIAFSVRVGDFIERIWTMDHLRDAWEYISKYPKDQIKSSVKMRTFYKNNQDIITTLYKRAQMYIVHDVMQDENVIILWKSNNTNPVMYLVMNRSGDKYYVSDDDLIEAVS